MIKKMSAAFTGGAANIWAMGKIGISDMIGLAMKPDSNALWATL